MKFLCGYDLIKGKIHYFWSKFCIINCKQPKKKKIRNVQKSYFHRICNIPFNITLSLFLWSCYLIMRVKIRKNIKLEPIIISRWAWPRREIIKCILCACMGAGAVCVRVFVSVSCRLL